MYITTGLAEMANTFVTGDKETELSGPEPPKLVADDFLRGALAAGAWGVTASLLGSKRPLLWAGLGGVVGVTASSWARSYSARRVER